MLMWFFFQFVSCHVWIIFPLFPELWLALDFFLLSENLRKSWLIGRLWCCEGLGAGGKGTTEDEMAGWHHQLDGRESEWTPGVGDGQGGLACCDSWGHKQSDTLSDWTELNWTEESDSRGVTGLEDHNSVIAVSWGGGGGHIFSTCEILPGTLQVNWEGCSSYLEIVD